jgi:hypothetical protein
MKSMMMAGFLVLSGFVSQSALADATCSQKPEIGSIREMVDSLSADPACLSLKETPEAGATCKTESGFVFVRFSDGWKDLATGRLWLDDVGHGKQAEAQKHCAGLGAALPSMKDFDEANKHGISEILRDSFFRTFWTNRPYKEGETEYEILTGKKLKPVSKSKLEQFKDEKTEKIFGKKTNPDERFWTYDGANRRFGFTWGGSNISADAALCVK